MNWKVFLFFLVVSAAMGGAAFQMHTLCLSRPHPPGVPRRAYVIRSSDKEALYRSLDAVSAILNKAGVNFWAVCGTALGALRHGDMIPWDDDIDLGLLATDFDKAVSAVKQAGLSVHKTFFGCKIDGGVDLFPMLANGSYSSRIARFRWPKEHFDPSQLTQKPTLAKFGNTKVPLLPGTEEYLARWAGETWRTHCVINKPHEVRGVIPSTMWHLNPFIVKKFDLQ